MDDAQATRPVPQSLPALPHPTSITAPDSSAYLLINEARRKLEQLEAIKHDVLQGTLDCSLSPPLPDALPPLPPIPLPPLQQPFRRSSITSSSKLSRPILRPSFPSGSYLARQQTFTECLEGFNREGSSTLSNTTSGTGSAQLLSTGCSASTHQNDSAIFVELGKDRKDGGVWIVLRRLRRDGTWEDGQDSRLMEVESVRIFPHSESSSVPPIHADTKASLQTTLSHHLTELRLSLPEIMYRIPALPRLITQSCNYCHKHLRVQDGQPCQRTGWLPPPNDRPANGYSYLDGRSPEAAGMQQEDGRWVCWHTSCDPSP